MNLPTKLIKDFATMANNSSVEEKPITQLYGTVKVVEDKKYVILDGSNSLTPISEIVDVQADDRVLVSIENHKATIIGNFTFPPSARKTNDALEKSESAETTAQEAKEQVEADAEKITAAQEAAAEASTKANKANSLAQEASTKASEVYTLADEAKTAAQSAESKAAEAMINVGTANTEIAAIRAEVDAVNADVDGFRADFKNQIKTEVETLSVNYATKTDLTTIEGNFTAAISKSAAELQATLTESYVAKSDNVALEERLQSQITQNAGLISSSVKSIEKLETDTTEAQKAIDAAQKNANDAIAAATEAQTKASAAQTAATDAKSKADAADAALKEAQNDLAEAEKNLDAVTNRVDATDEEVAAAKAAVAAAQTAVNKAQADATAAATAASNAQTAANNAATKAQEAKNAADKAQEDVNNLTSRVTTAETKIEQTSEQISLVASRTTTVENNFANYSTTEQMNAAINTKADSITSTVSKTYATNSRVDDVEDTADAAASDASTAKSNAATALSTANTAASNASTALTTATQTADKFTWIVKSGTSSSNFTITDRMATLTAEKINLNGLVAFSGLNSDAQSKVNTAASDASTAKSNAATALSTANTAASDASTAKTNASTALSTANSNASKISSWCHANNTTYIDGSKIYTGSITAGQIASNAVTTDKINAGAITAAKIATGAITADKISVTSLQAISASIGGFTIGSTYIANGTTSLGTTADSVYLGTSGISCGKNFKVEKSGFITMRSYDTVNNVWYSVKIGEDVGPVEIVNESDTNDWVIISSDGIYRDASKKIYFQNDFFFENQKYLYWDNISDKAARVLGLNGSNILLLGDADNINSIQSYNIIRFDNTGCDVGTTNYPSGNHVIGNNKYVSGRTTASKATTVKLIGIDSSNRILIGDTSLESEIKFLYGSSEWRICTHSDDEVPVVQDRITAAYTKSSAGNVYMTSSGVMARSTSSSRRYKENISAELSDHLNPDKLYNLPVVEYVYKEGYLNENDPLYKQKIIGFIAEDVADIYPNAVQYNEDGTVEMWNYKMMIPAMLKLIQNQHKTDIQIINRLDSTTERIEALQNQLNEAMLQVASLQKQIDILKAA